MDVIENSNLSGGKKEKIAKQKTVPTKSLLSKRKQPETKPIGE